MPHRAFFDYLVRKRKKMYRWLFDDSSMNIRWGFDENKFHRTSIE